MKKKYMVVLLVVVILFMVGITINESKKMSNEDVVIDERITMPLVNEGEYAAEVSQYIDNENNIAVIPAGFTVSNVVGETNIQDGLVIYKGIIDDCSIAKETSNQYVWIPSTIEETDDKVYYSAGNMGEDERHLVNIEPCEYDIEYGITKEVLMDIVNQIEEEHKSIKNYGGYYIGRYEIGNLNSDVIIAYNKEPYTAISWKFAYDSANQIDVGNAAQSYLCSNYAWNTAIKFIEENSVYKDYSNSKEFYNENRKNSEVVDINGNIIKRADEKKIINTGLTTAKCNIYDMAGNVEEFTTGLAPEIDEGDDCIATVCMRGGEYSSKGNAELATFSSSEYARKGNGFRTTLFIK